MPGVLLAGGSLFLINRRILRNFCRDGHNWRKKRDGKTVGEAHERLKVCYWWICLFVVFICICLPIHILFVIGYTFCKTILCCEFIPLWLKSVMALAIDFMHHLQHVLCCWTVYAAFPTSFRIVTVLVYYFFGNYYLSSMALRLSLTLKPPFLQPTISIPFHYSPSPFQY